MWSSYAVEAEHVGHGVEARLLVAGPERGAHRAFGKQRPVVGHVRQFDPLRRRRQGSRYVRRSRCRRAASQSRSCPPRARRYARRATRTEWIRQIVMSRPLAAASPSISAVPEGASTFRLWCISRISMSKPGSSARRLFARGPASRLTPSEKLPGLDDPRPGLGRLRGSPSSSSSEQPVVPMMCTSPRSAAFLASATELAGAVKSMIACAPASAASTWSTIATSQPSRSRRARRHPCRSRAEPIRSKAENSCKPRRLQHGADIGLRPSCRRPRQSQSSSQASKNSLDSRVF